MSTREYLSYAWLTGPTPAREEERKLWAMMKEYAYFDKDCQDKTVQGIKKAVTPKKKAEPETKVGKKAAQQRASAASSTERELDELERMIE